MPVQIQLQPLELRPLRGLDHPFQLDIGGQGLQQLRIGLKLCSGVLPELEKRILQRLRSAGIPAQQGAGPLPLLFQGGFVQKAAVYQIGQGAVPVIQGHHRLADAGVAAVELEPLGCPVTSDLPGVAFHAAPVSIRQSVDGLAEGGMPLEDVDIPALRVQDVSRYAGKYIEVGQQLKELLLVKQNVHRAPFQS